VRSSSLGRRYLMVFWRRTASRPATVAGPLASSQRRNVVSSHSDAINRLQRFIGEIRTIRERTCEPKDNSNPRYHALSTAVSQLNRAIADMRTEDG